MDGQGRTYTRADGYIFLITESQCYKTLNSERSFTIKMTSYLHIESSLNNKVKFRITGLLKSELLIDNTCNSFRYLYLMLGYGKIEYVC